MLPSSEIASSYLNVLDRQFLVTLNEENNRLKELGRPWPVFLKTDYLKLSEYFAGVSKGNKLNGDITSLLTNYSNWRLLLPFSNGFEVKATDKDVANNIESLVALASQNFDKYLLERNISFHPARIVEYGNANNRQPWEAALARTGGKGFNLVISRPGGPFTTHTFTNWRKIYQYKQISKEQIFDLNIGLNYFCNLYKVMSSGGIAFSQIPFLPFQDDESEKVISDLQQMLLPYEVEMVIGINYDRIPIARIVKHSGAPKQIVPANPFGTRQLRHGEYGRNGELALDFNQLIPPQRLNPPRCPACPFNPGCRFHGLDSIEGMHQIARSTDKGAQYADETVRTVRGEGFTTQSKVEFGSRGNIRTVTCNAVRSDGKLVEIGRYSSEP